MDPGSSETRVRSAPFHPIDAGGFAPGTILIDRDGNIRNIYSSGTLDVRLVLADVRTLLAEQPEKNT